MITETARRFVGSLILTIVLSLLVLLGVVWFLSLFSNIGQTRNHLILIMAAGTFGGLIRNFIDKDLRFSLCEYRPNPERGFMLGSLAEAMIGMSSALAVFFILAGTLRIEDKEDALLRLVALSLVAGIGGRSILSQIRTVIEKQIGEADRKATQANIEAERAASRSEKARHDISIMALMTRASGHAIQREWREADILYKKLLGAYPNYPDAYMGRAYMLKRMARDEGDAARRQELYERAIEDATAALNKKPDYAIAFYNRACYKVLANKPVADIVVDLRNAISLDSTYKEMAAADEDFSRIRELDEFRATVQ